MAVDGTPKNLTLAWARAMDSCDAQLSALLASIGVDLMELVELLAGPGLPTTRPGNYAKGGVGLPEDVLRQLDGFFWGLLVGANLEPLDG